MQPFFVPQAGPPKKKQLPTFLKVILVLKALAALLVLGLTFITMAAVDSHVDRNALTDTSRATLHAMGQILLVVMLVQLLELIGVAGTWNFKRWGVYLLAGFSMLDIVLNLKISSTSGLSIGLATTLIVGFGIAVRWNDFD